jgi:hypothetical protein
VRQMAYSCQLKGRIIRKIDKRKNRESYSAYPLAGDQLTLRETCR